MRLRARSQQFWLPCSVYMVWSVVCKLCACIGICCTEGLLAPLLYMCTPSRQGMNARGWFSCFEMYANVGRTTQQLRRSAGGNTPFVPSLRMPSLLWVRAIGVSLVHCIIDSRPHGVCSTTLPWLPRRRSDQASGSRPLPLPACSALIPGFFNAAMRPGALRSRSPGVCNVDIFWGVPSRDRPHHAAPGRFQAQQRGNFPLQPPPPLFYFDPSVATLDCSCTFAPVHVMPSVFVCGNWCSKFGYCRQPAHGDPGLPRYAVDIFFGRMRPGLCFSQDASAKWVFVISITGTILCTLRDLGGCIFGSSL